PLALRIALSGVEVPLEADLLFEIDAPTGLLSRNTIVRHRGGEPDVDVTATLAFWYGIHEPIDDVWCLAGAWAQETQVQHSDSATPLALESRAGKTGFAYQPYLAMRAKASTYLCQICWSGNWALQAEPSPAGATLSGGLNNWQFRCRLSAGGNNALRLPTVLFGRFQGDQNAATQHLHNYRRKHRPDPARPIPVQFNSWYPYLGEPNATAMLALVPLAKRLGCEAFVVDAGWFRTDEDDSASDWTTRTGDWHTSRLRFPNGLREISAACREQGLHFGLWFEPEVIGSLSAIRQNHPEWLHHLDGQPPPVNERAILNLGVPAARRYAFERITRILSRVGVGWMKWDFNADLGAGGWAPGLPETLTDLDPLVAHYEGLYRLQDAIRRWFPDLILEMCASGGGRMDCEILSHAHVNWVSDQPGPLRKLAIHFGVQLAHPAVVCNDWLVEWPPGKIAGYDDDEDEDEDGLEERCDLPFRLRVAMLGSFGISAAIDHWPEADLVVAAEHVALYRAKLRSIIHHGDQYFLTPPPIDGGSGWAAVWYVAKGGSDGVLFAFRLGSGETSRVFALPGLSPERDFRASLLSAGRIVDTSAKALARGLDITVPGRFKSELVVVEARRGGRDAAEQPVE
ncbi:MAG: alpha-galactosidase, partial [Alphaproteobacteria bacterium]|nr:alpha-galactosidase [Alphaproteobacteria bacterium]